MLLLGEFIFELPWAAKRALSGGTKTKGESKIHRQIECYYIEIHFYWKGEIMYFQEYTCSPLNGCKFYIFYIQFSPIFGKIKPTQFLKTLFSFFLFFLKKESWRSFFLLFFLSFLTFYFKDSDLEDTLYFFHVLKR